MYICVCVGCVYVLVVCVYVWYNEYNIHIYLYIQHSNLTLTHTHYIGVYYGGHQLTRAANTLNRIARDLINTQKAHLTPETQLNTHKQGLIIDVHTGLGESGVDTIVSDRTMDEELFEEVWPTGMCVYYVYMCSYSVATVCSVCVLCIILLVGV